MNESLGQINKKDQIQARLLKTNSEKIEFYYNIYRKILFSDDFYSHTEKYFKVPYSNYLKYIYLNEDNIWKFVLGNVGLSILCLAIKK